MARDGEATLLETRRQVHDNGDETHLYLIDAPDESFQVLATDVDARGEALETEMVATTWTEEEAEQRLESWVDDNPKGVLGDETESAAGLSGAVDRLLGR